MHSELVDIEREVGSMTRVEHAGSLPSRPGLPGVSPMCGEVYIEWRRVVLVVVDRDCSSLC